MGLFDFFRMPDINEGVSRYGATPGVVLLDVRTPEEFRLEGRIPGSRNLPAEELQRASSLVEDRNTPLFVYRYSGARSSYAVSALRRMGYQQVTNIGGINRYRGKVEF